MAKTNMNNELMTNPLVLVIVGLLLLLIILGIIRVFMPTFSAGLGVNAHFGTIKGGVNLEAFDNQNKPCFVIFKADWCGHCKNTMPEFQKLMDEKLDNVEVIAIDSDKQPDLIKEHGVQGFPTIRMYPQGLANKDTYEDFNGERNLDGFKTFLERLLNAN
jgi:thiol-disulfide isomerase/thioredoxin